MAPNLVHRRYSRVQYPRRQLTPYGLVQLFGFDLSSWAELHHLLHLRSLPQTHPPLRPHPHHRHPAIQNQCPWSAGERSLLCAPIWRLPHPLPLLRPQSRPPRH